MLNSIYEKRKSLIQTAKNRKQKPVLKKLGDIDVEFLNSFKAKILNWSLEEAYSLRNQVGIETDSPDMIEFYKHCNIQTAECQSQAQGTDFVNVEYFYLPLVEQIESILGDTFRMRWARLEANKVLDWHIDPPNGDRFIIVTSGSHVAEVKTKEKTYSQEMLPGEVWYLNSNWYHRVVNNNNFDRYAILGCFDINNTIINVDN